jgi:hypothetical protein
MFADLAKLAQGVQTAIAGEEVDTVRAALWHREKNDL